MEILQEMLQQIDWNKLLPIFTFLLGLSYTFLDKRIERNRSIKNIKNILVYEMFSNYLIVDDVCKPEHEDEGVSSIATMLGGITTSVYDTYLGRLHTLKESDVLRIFLAYQHIALVLEYKERYMRISAEMEFAGIGENEQDLNLNMGKSLVSHCVPTKKSLAKAICAFKHGGKLMSKPQSGRIPPTD